MYEVFDSFTDRPYGNAFVFITYLKPFTITMCEVFIIIILLIFFVHISICILTFLIFCLIKC